MTGIRGTAQARQPLYTPDQKKRRDTTRWTMVQGVLAPVQFLVFLISLGLVCRYLINGEGYAIASWSIVVKTGFLYLIMVTGAIWEKVVFGQWLFAPAFFWEDVFSFAVIALHTLYIYGLFWTGLPPMTLMVIALAAYAAYAVNAGQFVWKLRMARLQSEVTA
ncbi:MAG: 2-vinyl bacteriochlorophyllide hydratase [Sulfitobacter sp.]